MSYTVYVLHLNDMRSPKYEMLQPICWANSKEALEQLLEQEKVEPYKEDRPGSWVGAFWGKSYRKGGPLEWCNPPYIHDEDRHYAEYECDTEPGPGDLNVPHVSDLMLDPPEGWTEERQVQHELEQLEDAERRLVAGGMDSTNQPIAVGDRVRVRGKVYTIEQFVEQEGRLGCKALVFTEPPHVDEPPCELNVDRYDGP